MSENKSILEEMQLEEIKEQTAEESEEQVIEEAEEQVAEEAEEQVAEEAEEQVTEESEEQVTEESEEQTAEESEEQTAEESEEQTAEESEEQVTEEAEEQVTEESEEQVTEESEEQAAEESEEQAAEESEEQTTEKVENEVRFEERSSLPKGEAVPYHERYYLKYREGKRSETLDLEGTKTFLQEIGFDGGELRQARERKNCAENLRNTDKNKNNQMRCSYCGSEISGVEFFRLPDGRMRCNTCSNTVVKSKAEVEELCKRVITNMDSFFGATIDIPVSIEVTEERKLKKKLGVPLGTKDSQSILILGVAINKKQKYRIILENGAPRISLIATFAHELTHIWQYTHWDNNKKLKKCPKDKRLLIYEGMAKWAEIQYLYLVGETTVARREENITRNRQDEYGIGFCLYEDYYPLTREAMSCEETPFTPNSYPFD